MKPMYLRLKSRLLLCKIKALWQLCSNRSANAMLAESLAQIDLNRWQIIIKTYRHYESMAILGVYTDFSVSAKQQDLTDFIATMVTVDCQDHWLQIKNHDGPVIFVTPHYGPFVLGCLKAVLDLGADKRVNAFYDPPEKNPDNAIYKDILGRLGDNFNPLFNDKRGLVRALKVLKNNEILTMMPDVYELSGQSLSVPFFSHLSVAMAGTAFLALKSNALIVHGYCCPERLGRIKCIVKKPFIYNKTENFDKDIFDLTAMIFANMEEQFRQQPEYWIYLRQLSSRLDIPLPTQDTLADLMPQLIKIAESVGIDSAAITELLKPEAG